MNSLVLEISEIKTAIEDMRLKLEDYEECLNTYLDGIKKVDSCWNDINTQVFIDIVTDEKEDFKEHAEATEKHMDFILDFCDSLQTELNEILDENTLNKIQYYSSIVDSSDNFLDNAKSGISEVQSIYNSLSIPSGCTASYDIRAILDNISDSKILSTKNDIVSNINKIRKVVAENKEEANALTFVTIDDKICELNYSSNDN